MDLRDSWKHAFEIAVPCAIPAKAGMQTLGKRRVAPVLEPGDQSPRRSPAGVRLTEITPCQVVAGLPLEFRPPM
jgi:hypothetical protein